MPTEAERNQQARFLRGGNLPNAGAGARASQRAAAGRIAERQATGGGPDQKGTKKKLYDAPRRPAVRATLVERDNEREFLEFHWNPSTYKISKSAKWTESPVQKGHPTLEFAGTGLTVLSFEALLNNIAQPHKIQMSTENCLQWLFDRLRARSDPIRVSPETAPRGLPWMNLQDAKASLAPPILVLFGVSRPFTCVLESVNITTIFQGQNAHGSSVVRDSSKNLTNFGAFQQAQSTFNLATNFDEFQNPLADQINLANEVEQISRATVQLQFKEYVNDPATESK